MKFSYALFYAVLVVSLSTGVHQLNANEDNIPQEAAKPHPGEQTAQSLSTTDGQSINYLIFLPEESNSDGSKTSKQWPLMIFLHGAGERGNDLDLVKKWGPPKIVQTDKSFPFVLVSPQCPARRNWNVEHLKELIDHVANQYKIDQRKIYLTGLSMGGHGTWATASAHPDLFAAIAPVCGFGNVNTANKLVDVPTWAFHGEADKVVPLSATTDMVRAIRKNGGDRVKLTIYAGVGHNSWTPTYANQDLFRWMLTKQK